METIQIDILNPKAKNVLKDLASLDLITIRESSTNDFSDVLARMRSQSEDVPTPEEITQEVEAVRSRQQEG